MPHTNNAAGLELTIPIEKREHNSMREDNSASMIPFPDVPTNLQDVEQNSQHASVETNTSSKPKAKPEFPVWQQRSARFVIFLVVVGVLFFGRFSVPDESVPCLVDKIMNGLSGANKFILTPGHESYRRAFQILGSLLIDLTFIVTFIYWIIKTPTLRFPLTLGAFYLIRMVVQKFIILPYPEGFYWDDPGFPSFVVPYGRGSDFFFSGHSGFVVICLREMWVSKNRKTSAIMFLVLVYTVFCLLIYQIHYFIDIFTGVFFADYCFYRVQQICNALVDPLCYKILLMLKKKYIKMKKIPQVENPVQPDQSQRQADEVEINNKPEVKIN